MMKQANFGILFVILTLTLALTFDMFVGLFQRKRSEIAMCRDQDDLLLLIVLVQPLFSTCSSKEQVD